MLKAIIISYLLLVLAIAGFARAEDSIMRNLPIHSDTIQFNEDSFSIYLSGDLSVGCETNPIPHFQLMEDQSTVILTVVAQGHPICTAQLDGQYDLVFDLRSQLAEHDISIGEGLTVKIGETGNTINLKSSQFDGSFPLFDTTLTGQLHINANGDVYLITEQVNAPSQAYTIKLVPPMTSADLQRYADSPVAVNGFVFEYKVPDQIYPIEQSGHGTSAVWLSGVSSI